MIYYLQYTPEKRNYIVKKYVTHLWCVLQTGFGGTLCAKKSRATFWPQSAPAYNSILQVKLNDL